MLRSTIALSVLASGLFASTALAAPYCSDLASEDALAKNYKRLAPIHSSTDTGWIFTADHVKETYAMKSLAQRLMAQISAEFAARDVRFGIMVAPPRPIVAGQDVVSATLDGAAYDLAAAASSFDQLIAELNESGAVAPNLAAAALADPALATDYYFKRDTHWTPLGAAVSAYAFAGAAKAAWPDLFQADTSLIRPTDASDTYSEKGSLAAVVEATCGTRPDPELTPYVTFEGGLERGLLDDLPEGTPKVALLGTSFSNRYEEDAYRVADALENALGASVDNYSFTGGGMTGALETFILNGKLSDGGYDLVLWEVPYTQSFNSTSNLYQLLGALQFEAGAAEGGTQIALGSSDKVDIDISAGAPTGITLSVASDDMRRVTLKVVYDDGKKETIKLQRSTRIPADQRVDQWSARFSPSGSRVITGLSAEFSPSAPGAGATATLWSQ